MVWWKNAALKVKHLLKSFSQKLFVKQVICYHVSIYVNYGNGNAELKNRIKDYGVIFRVNSSDVFYFINKNELLNPNKLTI